VVLVKELGHRARGAAGDLLEGAGGVVVLAGQDRPLARDEQLSGPRRYPGAGEAVEELPLGRDPEGDEVLSTDRRVTCSIEEIPAAALIAIRCRAPSIPVDPIAMNTVRIPSSAAVRSRGSSRRVGRMCSPPGSPKARRALPGSRTSAATASPRASTPRTIWLPTRPVAPITAVVIVSPSGKARSVRGRAQQDDGARQD